MKNKKQWQKVVFSAFVIWTMFVNSLPTIKAQDIVTSDDISGGSSVFVFRTARKTQQVKAAFRNNNIKGSAQQRAAARKKVNNQAIAAVAKKRTKTNKVDPNTVAINNVSDNRTKTGKGKTGKTGKTGTTDTPVKTATVEQTSIALAGAAETFLEKNDLANAIQYFETAVELDSKNENAKLGLSEAYTRKADDEFDKKSPAAAIASYQQAIKYNSQNAAAYAGLGAAYEADEANERALENYAKALAIDKNLTSIYAPLGLLYFQKGDIAQADDNLTKAVANNPDDVDSKYFLGVIRYKQNRNEEALEVLKQTVAVNPTSAEVHYYLGETYDRLKRYPEALAEYNQAVQLNPNYVDAWFDLGVANYNRALIEEAAAAYKFYEESVAAYKQVIRLKNDYAQAHANLADVYRQMAMDAKEPEKKKENFNLANGEYTLANVWIKDDPELYSNWGFCLGRVQKWDTAAQRLNTAVSLSPDAADYSNIGWAYHNAAVQEFQARDRETDANLKAKRDADAKAKLENGKVALQKSVELKPKFFPAYHNLGSVLLDLGDNQGAVNALNIANEIRKDFLPTVLQLGFAYRQLNDLTNAVKYLKQVTQLNDNSVLGWYYLGEAEYRRGNSKEVKKAQEKLNSLGQKGYANRLEVMLKSPLLTNPQNKLENKIKEKNPLNKIPRPF
jgi:tetratricopeptide (TPR) repeat protein